MKRLLVLFIIILALAGCSSKADTEKDSQKVLASSWSDIEKVAAGKKVRLFMWGGDPGINAYIDEYVKPAVKEKNNILLERVPMDTPEILQKLETEKRAGQTEGTIDIVWLNGENFKNAKQNNLLLGPITEKLPNYTKYYDTKSLENLYDFGLETEGYEAPWGKVQFVFHYDSSKIVDPPKTIEDLKKWVKANPGQFAYPDPKDFTGNAFIRHLFYESAGGAKGLLDKGYDEKFAKTGSERLWKDLNELEPYLWKKGKLYPNDLTELDKLYANGELAMTMGYNEARAESLIEKGVFLESTRSFVLESGSIGNTHFLAIPANSSNKEAALASINFLLSPEAQIKKLSPEYWGESPALDYSKLSNQQKAEYDEIKRGDSVLKPEQLKDAFLPEIDSRYVNWLKENWTNEVVQK
ncbi:ABC transporter substrate-binding protein [Metabacillus sp. KIGAM252]|uniref:ABC transporter substrate-binding protein n=1 Tax=Metabacillus flavus TaxID=2823519 RepID=A0ABS5LHE4_9BACI|nr:ABC transporter substrate-binding protein [Metabacillus flavus]MBS2970142.1 ABC transporter substrate-binding protein [Metabacillus flavus]